LSVSQAAAQVVVLSTRVDHNNFQSAITNGE
jgi:hypothetical protein